jgi:hypothetical protein
MKKIPLTQGKEMLIDDWKFDEMNQYKWCAHKIKNTWYAARNTKDKKTVHAHCQVMGFPDGIIDHKNQIGLDNRECNLRLCSVSQNAMNSRKIKNKSGFRGVCFDKRKWRQKRWYARIRNGEKKAIFLGFFFTSEDAARAYDEKAKELFGEFASLNFPDEKQATAIGG